jgi:hypothetical protein
VKEKSICEKRKNIGGKLLMLRVKQFIFLLFIKINFLMLKADNISIIKKERKY